MTEAVLPTMSEAVEVDVDRATAFAIFTDEFDEWWGNGPIDSWDSSRVVEHRIEPEAGGRLLEVYADDVLELGTITVWEPPHRLCWTSSVDDALIEVTFEELPDGTRVRVTGTATTPNAGAGFAVVRMAPQWLPRYVNRRKTQTARPTLGRLNIVLRSREPAAMGRWLVDAFGFVSQADIPDEEPTDPEQTWIELRVGGGEAAVILWGAENDRTLDAPDPMPWVYVDDLDAHLARAEQAGAAIVSPVVHHGFRSYTAADREGRHWLFAQAPPSVIG